MLLHCEVMHSLSVSALFGSFDRFRILQEVVSGIEGGQLHGIPWQVLPLTRSLVQERLALAAFSNCCCNLSSALWLRGSSTDINFICSGNPRCVLGCFCSGWQEDVGGTLVFSERQGGSVLQQELFVLSCILNSPVLEVSNSTLTADSLDRQFDCIDIFVDPDRMAQPGDNAGIQDIKKNLRRLCEMVSIGIMDNREIARDIKKMEDTVSYTSLQISNHDSRIDDNKSTLRETLGKVDRIQEDLERLISMNQGSSIGATVAEERPMEEESVVQPVHFRGHL